MDELLKQLEEHKAKAEEWKSLKMKFISRQKWEDAADARDMERNEQAKCTFYELKIKESLDKKFDELKDWDNKPF